MRSRAGASLDWACGWGRHCGFRRMGFRGVKLAIPAAVEDKPVQEPAPGRRVTRAAAVIAAACLIALLAFLAREHHQRPVTVLRGVADVAGDLAAWLLSRARVGYTGFRGSISGSTSRARTTWWLAGLSDYARAEPSRSRSAGCR